MSKLFNWMWNNTKHHANKLALYLRVRKVALREAHTEMEAFGDGPHHPLP